MTRQVVTVKGKRFVLVPPAELRRLERLEAKIRAADDAVPPWPPADSAGNRPAVAFARVSIARSIVQERRVLGISQLELAHLSGLRQETISRLEAGKHSPTIRTVKKIERALQRLAALNTAKRRQK